MRAAEGGELPPDGLTFAVELAQIASTPGSTRKRASELLAALRRLLPFAAATVQVLDPERHQLTSLASTGPAPPVRDRLHSDVGVGLFTPDGRRVGLLTLRTENAKHLTDGARHLLSLLAPVMSTAVDPMRAIIMLAGTVTDATAGVVLTRVGSTLSLPGLPAHRVLGAGSAVLGTVDDQLADGWGQTSFLSPYPTDCDPDGHLRVTALACPDEPPYHLVAVVLVGPPGELCGLTSRELEVLGLIVEGWQNSRMAGALFISERTVAAHVEHVLAKLGAATRTRAAVRALRQGLYVPRTLTRQGSTAAA